MEKLKPGDIIAILVGHRVYADVPRHFVYSNCKGDYTFAHSDVTITGELSYLAGRYVVVDAKSEGGGCAHGPHDVYPDGWHVFCERLDDSHNKVDFFQSGCFTAMICDIEPVGRATQRWVEEVPS